MIIEVTTLKIKEGQQKSFEQAIKNAASSFIASFTGCQGYSIRRCIEENSQYVIEIQWKTLEAHMNGFRTSEAFTQWRSQISPYFAAQPTTYHCEIIATNSIS